MNSIDMITGSVLVCLYIFDDKWTLVAFRNSIIIFVFNTLFFLCNNNDMKLKKRAIYKSAAQKGF